MTYTEYKLTVSRPIWEMVSSDLQAVYYKAGDEVTFNEETFNSLKSGNLVKRYTQSGLIRFHKSDFENEVRTVSVVVENGITELGNS